MSKRNKRQDSWSETGYYVPQNRKRARDVIVTIAAVLVTAVLILVMVFYAPIIRYEKTEGSTLVTQQVSILDYWKRIQPLVRQEGTLSKPDANNASALNLKEDSDYDDGLDLEQIIEGQYTILFLGMDESGDLSDVNWLLQFNLIEGMLNILQIPRDSFMPDYASYSTAKFNSIYHSGQETGVTPMQRVVNAIEDSFCIYIDCYVKLNCTDIANIVDSIGGILITLPEEIVYEADKVLPAGEQVLDGEQSEWFVRFRYGYDEGDIGRVKAQRIFLAAAMEKMLDMGHVTLLNAMKKIYQNQWIATDLSLEEISMIADFASNRLTMDAVNVFMVPGEGVTYYPGDGTAQSVYSIHKSATIEMLNEYFRPFQNAITSEDSTIVELVPEGQYLASNNDDTQENLEDISEGDTEDGVQ
ncbi:MAG: LCP family protein [Ruminococcus sp.]|nr:LCP family protein [Ruminococcus sp.]